MEYKKEHGDCCVPTQWEPDPTLGAWVNRYYCNSLLFIDYLIKSLDYSLGIFLILIHYGGLKKLAIQPAGSIGIVIIN